MIESITCPGLPECSGSGQCVNGSCECSEGYIDDDCSILMTEPPDILGLRGEGVCDKSELPCDTGYLVADDIGASPNLSCKIQHFTVNVDDIRTNGTTQIIDAIQETVVEVICPFPEVDIEESNAFVRGVDIQISYDKVNFGASNVMYIFDSACQVRNGSADPPQFILLDHTCFINATCYFDGNVSSDNPYDVCDSTFNQFQWKDISADTTTEPSTSTLYTTTTTTTDITTSTVPTSIAKRTTYTAESTSMAAKSITTSTTSASTSMVAEPITTTSAAEPTSMGAKPTFPTAESTSLTAKPTTLDHRTTSEAESVATEDETIVYISTTDGQSRMKTTTETGDNTVAYGSTTVKTGMTTTTVNPASGMGASSSCLLPNIIYILSSFFAVLFGIRKFASDC